MLFITRYSWDSYVLWHTFFIRIHDILHYRSKLFHVKYGHTSMTSLYTQKLTLGHWIRPDLKNLIMTSLNKYALNMLNVSNDKNNKNKIKNIFFKDPFHLPYIYNIFPFSFFFVEKESYTRSRYKNVWIATHFVFYPFRPVYIREQKPVCYSYK